MIVCSGRLPGPMQFGWPGSVKKQAPRFWRVTPVRLVTMPEPKVSKIELMNETARRVPVDDRQVDRVGARQGPGGGLAAHGARQRHSACQGPCRVCAQHFRDRDVGELRIADMSVPQAPCQAHRLDRQVTSLDAVGPVATDVEFGEHVEGDEGRDALPARRDLQHLAAVKRR